MKKYLLQFSIIAIIFGGVNLQSCKKDNKPEVDPEQPEEVVNGISTGVYKLIVAQSIKEGNTQALGVLDSSAKADAELDARPFASNTGQEWRLISLGGNEYNIINVHSGLALEAKAEKGAKLRQAMLNTTDTQKWIVNFKQKGAYRISSKSNKQLSVMINKTDGAVVLNTAADDDINAYFVVSPVAYKDKIATNWFGTRTNGFTAGDGGFTAALNDGSVLWTFGDSYIDNYRESDQTVPCVFNVNNQGLLQPANDWNWKNAVAVVAPGSGIQRTVWKTTASVAQKSYYWPVAGVHLGDTVYVFCNGVKTIGGFFGPTGVEAIFKMKVTAQGVEQVGYTEFPKDYFKGINFGVGFVKDEASGYVYVFGQLKPSGVFVFSTNVYVARFPINKPGEPWRFYKGGVNADDANWVADAGQAAIIGTGAGYNVSVGKIKGKYIIASNAANFCNDGKDIYVATGSTPTGPFSERRSVYQIDERHQGMSPMFYSTVIHPEHINTDNEVLITYSVNGFGGCLKTCDASFRMPRRFYTIKGIRVPLKMVDASF